MPIHNWTRVSGGAFHAFHLAWIAALQDALNEGVLSPDYYATAEQIAGPFAPDLLTLQVWENRSDPPPSYPGLISLVTAIPRVRFTAKAEMDQYVLKQGTLVIRQSSDERIIALLEIVSPGNKANRHALRSFVSKATEEMYLEHHLLIIDLHPPGPRDPQGIHGAIWGDISDEDFTAPPDKPLTLAAYAAGQIKRAFVEPMAVGDVLPDMPLFLEPEAYVNVPLETTYQAAYRGMPRRWQRVLEGASS